MEWLAWCQSVTVQLSWKLIQLEKQGLVSSISSSHYTRCWELLIPVSPFWGLLLLIQEYHHITMLILVDEPFLAKIELSDFWLQDFQFHSRAASLSEIKLDSGNVGYKNEQRYHAMTGWFSSKVKPGVLILRWLREHVPVSYLFLHLRLYQTLSIFFIILKY